MKRVLVFLLLVPASLAAAENLTDEKWLAELAVGYTHKSGNTDSSVVSVDGKVTREQEAWKHMATLEYDFESKDKQTTDDTLYLTWQSNYFLNEISYLFGFASFKDARYQGIDQEVVLASGYGRVLMDDDVYFLSIEAGPAARITNPTDGSSSADPIARFNENFSWAVSETASFKQDLSLESGSGNTTAKFSVALETAINSSLAMRLSYEVDHVHKVPDDRHNTDTKTMVSIVYKLQ